MELYVTMRHICNKTLFGRQVSLISFVKISHFVLYHKALDDDLHLWVFLHFCTISNINCKEG